MFQSTHPRRVWRSITSFSRARSVSIHTPTQGVTFYHLLKINFYPVSIHTPTQGVTISPHSRRPTGRSFNPHTHAGCDPGTGYLACRIPAVSIHTPTQGVTKFVFYFFMCHNCFNPHTHAGCDGSWVFWFNKFQGFNPHTHAGCDIISMILLCVIMVSIHTPTQGVTSETLLYSCWSGVSIHTPTQGVTGNIGYLNYKSNVSIHTPTQGVTPKAISILTALFGFNPHTHAGCDLLKVGQNSWLAKFQSTHPRRVWLFIPLCPPSPP